MVHPVFDCIFLKNTSVTAYNYYPSLGSSSVYENAIPSLNESKVIDGL